MCPLLVGGHPFAGFIWLRRGTLTKTKRHRWRSEVISSGAHETKNKREHRCEILVDPLFQHPSEELHGLLTSSQ